MVSLGCPKNLVDSETVLGVLASEGYVITASPADADIIFINTCGFIEPAVKEAIDTILHCLQYKAKGSCKYVVVFGCLVARYGESTLSDLLPEVDGWLGVDAPSQVVQYVNNILTGEKSDSLKSDKSTVHPRLLATPSHTAYLKIAEGCSHACAYCMIPQIRGPLQSRRPDAICREAEQLAAGGVKELILVAQDTGAYGNDLPDKPALADLLGGLVKIDGIHWIRFLYMNPYSLEDDVIELIQKESKLCPYMDLPFQHANRGILNKMGRKGDMESHLRLIERLKTVLPDLALRTTLMVGYPGEGQKAFEELSEFVALAQFDRLGVFPYYHEEGARSSRYSETVSYIEKRRRVRKIMRLQRKISRRKNQKFVGKELEVLIESNLKGDIWWGRSYRDSPDIDPRVIVRGSDLRTGSFEQIQITDGATYDLIGVAIPLKQ